SESAPAESPFQLVARSGPPATMTISGAAGSDEIRARSAGNGRSSLQQREMAQFESLPLLLAIGRRHHRQCLRQVEGADALPRMVVRLRTLQRVGLQVPGVDDVGRGDELTFLRRVVLHDRDGEAAVLHAAVDDDDLFVANAVAGVEL